MILLGRVSTNSELNIELEFQPNTSSSNLCSSSIIGGVIVLLVLVSSNWIKEEFWVAVFFFCFKIVNWEIVV